MPSYDMSDRIAASRAEMLAAYRRQQPVAEPAQEEERPTPPVELPSETEELPTEQPIPVLPDTAPVYDAIGYLQVHTMAANQSIPVPDALVIVTQTVDGNEEIVALGETDWSGNTATWPLPAPDPQQFEQSDTLASPAFYTVRTIADGYTVVRNLEVPLYGGIKDVQAVNMIPLPEAQPINEITFTAGGPADLR